MQHVQLIVVEHDVLAVALVLALVFLNLVRTVDIENFKSFELFILNDFIKRMTIDDYETMQMLIGELPSSLKYD